MACGGLESVNALLNRGADVNLIGNEGAVPRIVASMAGSLPLVQLMVSRSAKVNAHDARGYIRR